MTHDTRESFPLQHHPPAPWFADHDAGQPNRASVREDRQIDTGRRHACRVVRAGHQTDLHLAHWRGRLPLRLPSQAGREIQPAGIPAMIQGIILFCVVASDVLLRYRVRVVRR